MRMNLIGLFGDAFEREVIKSSQDGVEGCVIRHGSILYRRWP